MIIIEYLYIVWPRKHLIANEPVYKIGRTTDIERRKKEYPSGSALLFVDTIKDSNTAEVELKKHLCNTDLKQRTDLGSEYFEGDISIIKQAIVSVTTKNTSSPWHQANSQPTYQQVIVNGNNNNALINSPSTVKTNVQFAKSLNCANKKGTKPCICDICGKGFASNKSKWNHKKRMHPSKTADERLCVLNQQIGYLQSKMQQLQSISAE